jgi:hypothetical protein
MGLVYKSEVAHLNKDFIECRMKGNPESKELKHQLIAVGISWIMNWKNLGYSNSTIHNIHERKNYKSRKSVSHQMHIIANIDRVFLVTINNRLRLSILLIGFSNSRGLRNRNYFSI